MELTRTLERRTVFHTMKTKTLATIFAVIASVAFPQLFHWLGGVSGSGTALGQTFLPMHLPILMVGLLAGPMAGLIAGFMGPLLSFALSGMPLAATLPFMMVELAGYGLVAGLLANKNISVFGKLFAAQVAGRLIRAVAVLSAIYGFDSQAVAVSSIWGTVVSGLPGLVLQWSLIPLMMFWIANRERSRE